MLLKRMFEQGYKIKHGKYIPCVRRDRNFSHVKRIGNDIFIIRLYFRTLRKNFVGL